MRFLGHLVDICKMAGRPFEIGYKFHCVADKGYVWDFWPHSSPKNGYHPLLSTAVKPSSGALTPAGAIVLHLAKQPPYTSTSFNTFTANYYTTVALLQHPREIGTTRKTGAGYSDSLNVPEMVQEKVEYHYSTGVISGRVAVFL